MKRETITHAKQQQKAHKHVQSESNVILYKFQMVLSNVAGIYAPWFTAKKSSCLFFNNRLKNSEYEYVCGKIRIQNLF